MSLSYFKQFLLILFFFTEKAENLISQKSQKGHHSKGVANTLQTHRKIIQRMFKKTVVMGICIIEAECVPVGRGIR
jgi:hypothetical protein